jgi:hypothetical protein
MLLKPEMFLMWFEEPFCSFVRIMFRTSKLCVLVRQSGAIRAESARIVCSFATTQNITMIDCKRR